MNDWEDWYADPWEWFDDREPVCLLVCETTGDELGRGWKAPDGNLWVRTRDYQDPIDGTQHGAPAFFLLQCPSHGFVNVPAAWLLDSTDRAPVRLTVLCTDPTPVYRA